MKISMFHLMPHRFLPDDFETRYRSVWVDVPHHLFDPEKCHILYNEFLDELEHAERMGFDGLCVNEHHNNAYGLMQECGASDCPRGTHASLRVSGCHRPSCRRLSPLSPTPSPRPPGSPLWMVFFPSFPLVDR